MIVVDTNIIAYLWIPGVHTAQVEQVLNKDSDWAAPLLWRSEFRNVLTGYIRHNLLTLEVALQIASEAEAQMQNKEYEVSSTRVLKLVEKSACSVYDCEFIAVAQDLDIPLVTTDKKLLAEFPTIAVDIAQFLDR
jgi:predicted nucleic acid-binding protein